MPNNRRHSGPRRPPNDPVNDFFNELLDATLTTVIESILPEFRKIAKNALAAEKAKADRQANPPRTPREKPTSLGV
jgi:hypothetical protein